VRYKSLIWLLILSLFWINSLSAQKHPDDPGFADTLYFEAGEPCSEDGDTLFIPSDASGGEVNIFVKICNDNPIQAFSVPLMDTCGIGFLDFIKNDGGVSPLCFQGSRVEEFDFLSVNLNLNPPRVLYGAISSESPLPSGDGTFAKMVYTIPPGSSSACICLDSSFFPPGNTLRFVRADSVIGYVPFFKKRCFQVELRKETSVPENGFERPCLLDLKQNYPNPFNSGTTISFSVHNEKSTKKGPLHINISIYNILGWKVRTLLNQKKYPGEYRVFWDGKDDMKRDAGSGIYFYRLYFSDSVLTEKMLLLR
jgi:hypothetical protein